ncbi:hypothetical protein [Streptomyces globisporus]|uniref:hypothetical protein n=1 Tax=Streptomyces globisporus TaxID=1908 RepID=UPI0037FC3346
MTIRVVEDGPSPRILSASGPEAPADGQKIDWVAPTHIGPCLDRTSQIGASLESDASATSAVAEGWDAKNKAGRLRGNWL